MHRPTTTAIFKYDEIASMCEKFLGGLKASETVGEANEERKIMIVICKGARSWKWMSSRKFNLSFCKNVF